MFLVFVSSLFFGCSTSKLEAGEGTVTSHLLVSSLDQDNDMGFDYTSTVLCTIKNRSDFTSKGDVLIDFNVDGEIFKKITTIEIPPNNERIVTQVFKEAKLGSNNHPTCSVLKNEVRVSCYVENKGDGRGSGKLQIRLKGKTESFEYKEVSLEPFSTDRYSHTFKNVEPGPGDTFVGNCTLVD